MTYIGERIKITLTLDKNIIDIIMIDIDTYYMAYKLKKAQVFVVFMKDLELQATKKAKLETVSKSIVLEKYDNLLNIFSLKNSDILPFY